MASAVANLRSANGGNARFNAEARSWDTRPFVHLASKEAQVAILAKCNALQWTPKQVLEIGCGTGILSFLLAPYVDKIVAVDAAQGMIDVLQQKLEVANAPNNIVPVCVLLEDSEDLHLPPAEETRPDGPRQKFDLITSHLVLHHIADLRSVLKTMLDCLAPGGRAMLTDFQDFGPLAKRFHAASRLDGVERHGIDIEQMENLMKDVGFREVQITPEWTMNKKTEKYDGEFGAGGQPETRDQGVETKFPFVLCNGRRLSS